MDKFMQEILSKTGDFAVIGSTQHRLAQVRRKVFTHLRKHNVHFHHSGNRIRLSPEIRIVFVTYEEQWGEKLLGYDFVKIFEAEELERD